MIFLIFMGLLFGLSSCQGAGVIGSTTSGATLIQTWAGAGTQGYDGDGLALTQSWFNEPMEMVFDDEGTAVIVDWNSHKLRYVSGDQTLETIVGGVFPGDWPCQDPTNSENCEVPLGDSVTGTDLELNHPMDAALDGDGTFLVAAWHNHKVLRYNPTSGLVTVVAGKQQPGFSGDGGAATAALLNFPSSIVLDDSGNLFIADERNNRIRRVAVDGVITTVAGSASPPSTAGYSGDGGAATSARLALAPYDELGGSDNPPPGGALAMDADGNLFVADTFNHCIREIVPGTDGVIGAGDVSEELITTVAGTCTTSGFSGDGGAATAALLNEPFDLEFAPDGTLYIADTGNHVVRAVMASTQMVSTIAGTGGEDGFSGDDGDPTAAELNTPYGLAFDTDGVLYIIDTLNNRIRKVSVTP